MKGNHILLMLRIGIVGEDIVRLPRDWGVVSRNGVSVHKVRRKIKGGGPLYPGGWSKKAPA